MGGYAIQLARADGLRVIADAAPRDEQLVKEQGADIVLPTCTGEHSVIDRDQRSASAAPGRAGQESSARGRGPGVPQVVPYIGEPSADEHLAHRAPPGTGDHARGEPHGGTPGPSGEEVRQDRAVKQS